MRSRRQGALRAQRGAVIVKFEQPHLEIEILLIQLQDLGTRIGRACDPAILARGQLKGLTGRLTQALADMIKRRNIQARQRSHFLLLQPLIR